MTTTTTTAMTVRRVERSIGDRISLAGWPWASLLTAALVVAPIAFLAFSALDPNTEVWRQQWETRLPSQLIDTAVLWRVVNWFNARVDFGKLLPLRASTYIISILNEQVGKGAIAVYLNRRDGVPGWQLGSSMLFIMFCEFYYLLFWATLGTLLRWEQVPAVFHVLPVVAGVAALVFAIFILYFRGRIFPGSQVRERPILHAFRQANLGHYVGIILLRSPALLAAVGVYSIALSLFGVSVGYLEMLGYLPVIFFGAAVPGPMRSVAITLWVTLFPDNAGEMAAFGLVQHNFFIFFNAAIGMLFLRRANREIFGPSTSPQPSN